MLVRAIGTPFRWRRRDHRKRFLNATEKEAARVALEQRDAQKAENKRDPPRVALVRAAVIDGDQFRSPRGAKAEEAPRAQRGAEEGVSSQMEDGVSSQMPACHRRRTSASARRSCASR